MLFAASEDATVLLTAVDRALSSADEAELLLLEGSEENSCQAPP